MTAALSESQLRVLVRADLPAEAFKRRPWRILLAVPMVLTIAVGTIAIIWLPLPWWATACGSIVLGNMYMALMLFGHEAAHGAMVRSRRMQDSLLWFTFLIYLIPPHLWRFWHNTAHHAHTNQQGTDPDSFGSRHEHYHGRLPRLLLKLAPGSGHWLSVLYLFVAFTAQGQGVLWWKSRTGAARRRTFAQFRWSRAVAEFGVMVGFWVAVAAWAGTRGAVFGVLVPMLAANFVLMLYVNTNHLLRPLSEEYDSLRTTMSVRTLATFDLIHLHFSHHVEHHLFPAMSHRYYPLVRRSLMRHAPDRYLAPPHWRALRVLFDTPRVYDGVDHLIDLATGRRVAIADVESRLRGDRFPRDKDLV